MIDKRSLFARSGAALFALAACALAGCASLQTAPKPPAGQAVVSSADARASEAGMEILRAGGNATDAAIATMMVLGLVEPQSAGVGGGGFALTYAADNRAIIAYDGREWAPAAAGPGLFLGEDGRPMAFREAVLSGRSVGTPSLIAMLYMLHQDQGRLPWASLFEPAIRLAENGFELTPRLHEWIEFGAQRGRLLETPAVRAYFFDDAGTPKPIGTILRNPAYAASLRAIAIQGPRALTHGQIAQDIIAAVQAGPNPGSLTLEDLQAYRPRRLDPVCGPYRSFRVCSMGPPSSGAVAVLSILGQYEAARPMPNGPNDADDWSAFLWASRLAYADRDHYVADDQFVPVPTEALVAPAYLRDRARQIDLTRAPAGIIQPGDPSLIVGGPSYLDRWGRDRTNEVPGTTHLSVVDSAGNAVALTATVESIFGSQRFAAGFFLNNQLTDFSLDPLKNGLPVANAPGPRKRPRSSMSPTVILNSDGSLHMVIGSPGGSAIISYVARTIIGVIDWDLPIQAAIDQPIMVASRPGAVRAEVQLLPPGMVDQLQSRGWTIQPTTMEASGLHGVLVTPEGLEGGADPRREGRAIRETITPALTPSAR
ncbi:MAG: gamma-glutamyltransferase [Caulobacterales bacterium]